jgi:hypothetical protein
MSQIKYNLDNVRLCACLGAMYGEPYCPCEMKNRGLQSEMDSNPIRKAAEKRDAESYRKFMEEGGWEKLFGTRKDELDD